jgi:hypothetical protein
VDRQLAKEGRLVLIETPADVHAKIKLARRAKEPPRNSARSTALEEIVQHVQEILKLDGRNGAVSLTNGRIRDVVLANK